MGAMDAGENQTENLPRMAIHVNLSETWTVAYTYYSLAVVLIAVASSIYLYLRPILPINVQCWFCGETNRLPPDNKNQFDCRYCEQYNGFTKSGDYNKPIPAQGDPSMNFAQEGFCANSRRKLHEYHNGLCNLCNERQVQKMRQRDEFEFNGSANEDEQLREFLAELDRRYKLCPNCQKFADNRIGFQNAKLVSHMLHIGSKRWTNRLHWMVVSDPAVILAYACSLFTFSVPSTLSMTPLMPAMLMSLFGVSNIKIFHLAAVARISVIICDFIGKSLDGSLVEWCHLCFVLIISYCVLLTVQKFLRTTLSGKRTKKNFFTSLPDLVKALAPRLNEKRLNERDLHSSRPAVGTWSSQASQISSDYRTPTPSVLSAPQSFVFGRGLQSPKSFDTDKFSSSFRDCTPNSSQDSSDEGDRMSWRTTIKPSKIRAAQKWVEESLNPFASISLDKSAIPKSLPSSKYAPSGAWRSRQSSRMSSKQNSPLRRSQDWDQGTNMTGQTVQNIYFTTQKPSFASASIIVLLAGILLRLCWSDIHKVVDVFTFTGVPIQNAS